MTSMKIQWQNLEIKNDPAKLQ